jgi:hypothetical protein
MRAARFLGFAVVAVLAILVLGVATAWMMVRSSGEDAAAWSGGEVTASPRPTSAGADRSARQSRATERLGGASDKQILFGDLHVHTTFSADAFSYSLPIYQGAGARPPADACDFARFCSQLDFWSINDHAESIGATQWAETVRAIQECNAAALDPAAPDLVSFLGWEWSQGSGGAPADHYGHKNVVLLPFEDGEVPERPVAAGRFSPFAHLGGALANSLSGPGEFSDYAALHQFLGQTADIEPCPNGVDVHDLPEGCIDVATTPDVLFEKLEQWGAPAIVIPHGLAWGITNPPAADAVNQIAPPMHDPRWQRLIEVYSGHGNSEVFVDFERESLDADGRGVCPAPTDRFEPCCHRAGEIARARCEDPATGACAENVAAVREEVARLQMGLGRYLGTWAGVVPDVGIEAYGDCGQLRDGFLSANEYRPRQSAQYASTRTVVDEQGAPAYWRLGFIGSSDNHSARPGTGFKEFGRLENTEGYSRIRGVESVSGSYFFTGGLAAVHSSGRDRGAVFDALHRREVYGTSGDRILLWFDLLGDGDERFVMGSQVARSMTPRFEVKAVGAFEQRPGCPDFVRERLTPERLDWLCMGECFHPSETRKPITRIEVVRIRPQQQPEEELAPLIEDPWQILPCPAEGLGCVVQFEDPEFGARETLYYVRAIQAPSPAVNGDPLSCDRDEAGRCIQARLCTGTGMAGDPATEDCLAPVAERAWSSPIWVRPN